MTNVDAQPYGQALRDSDQYLQPYLQRLLYRQIHQGHEHPICRNTAPVYVIDQRHWNMELNMSLVLRV